MPRLTYRSGITRRARPSQKFSRGDPTIWESDMERKLGIRREEEVRGPTIENLQFTPGKERK